MNRKAAKSAKKEQRKSLDFKKEIGMGRKWGLGLAKWRVRHAEERAQRKKEASSRKIASK